MLAELRRRRTMASFDYQWAHLRAGDAMLSDPWFVENAERILVEELLAVEPAWFANREVLDAGCGGGRWTLALLRLGCRVLAVDASPQALRATNASIERLLPSALAEGRLTLMRADLLALPAPLRGRRFDLVFSFGVLHHTGDTRRALGNVAALAGPGGVLFVYLYGRAAVRGARRLGLALLRASLAPLPFPLKRAALARLLPGRDVHQAFDLLSPLVNDRLDHATVEAWVRELGFTQVERTIPHPDVFLRACRSGCTAPLRPPAAPPYWFERYRCTA